MVLEMKTKFHFHRISKNGVGSSEHPLGPPLCFKYVVTMTDDGTKAHIQHIDTQMTSENDLCYCRANQE